MSGEIPSLVDLQNTKVRIDHFAELIDGTLSGTSTNPITGVTHPTYNKIISEINTIINSMGYDWKFIISPTSIVIAVSVSILIGIIFGFYPAKRAANLSPMEALRYE